MAFYDLSKEERIVLVDKVNQNIQYDLKQSQTTFITCYFSDDETYIRKTVCLAK